MSTYVRSLLVLLAVVCFAPGHSHAQFVPIPPLSSLVVDQTGVLGSDADALKQQLLALKRERGSEIAVLIVPTTKPETIEQYSIRVVDQWKLGRSGIDDGALLLVALKDRTVRIEVGRGLEGDITDLKAHRIIDERIVPKFRQGDIPGGVEAGVAALIASVRGMELPPPSKPTRSNIPALLIAFVFALFWGHAIGSVAGRLGGAIVGGVGLFLVGAMLTNIAIAGMCAAVCGLLIFMIPPPSVRSPYYRSSTSRRSGNWGSGGFGGGGFSSGGGFGGGGSFGGGGASGRW